MHKLSLLSSVAFMAKSLSAPEQIYEWRNSQATYRTTRGIQTDKGQPAGYLQALVKNLSFGIPSNKPL